MVCQIKPSVEQDARMNVQLIGAIEVHGDAAKGSNQHGVIHINLSLPSYKQLQRNLNITWQTCHCPSQSFFCSLF